MIYAIMLSIPLAFGIFNPNPQHPKRHRHVIHLIDTKGKVHKVIFHDTDKDCINKRK